MGAGGTMKYKGDWEQAKRRMVAWWEGEVIDRPCVQITAPRDGCEQAWHDSHSRSPDVSLEQWWTDVDYVVQRTAKRMEATFFGGEAFPNFAANIGPDAFAAFLGAPLRLLETTTWVDHIIDDWSEHPALCIDAGNRWWNVQVDLLRAAQEAGRDGLWLTGVPDIHAGGDALSALRGPSRLCLDLYDQPDAVKRASQQLIDAVRYVLQVYFGILEPEKYGSTCSWLPGWHPGRVSAVQCDFSAFVSPRMMEEFIMPSVVAEARCLDRAIYHLDGPDAVRHLDLLLATPELHAIQWVPGAGALPMTRWIPLLQRIQAGGKSLWVGCTADEVPTLLEALQPEGLLLHTSTQTEQEARDLLDLAARRS
jgi:hypothetical protein